MKAEEWVVDSGATTHMTWDKGVFVTYAVMEDMPSVRLGDGRTVKAEGKGSVCLRIRDNKQAERKISLSSVLFVPDLSCNLFSVRDITDKGNRMMFDDITCNVITRGDIVIASGYKRGNLYVLDGTADRQPDEALVAAQPSSDLWHQRLAHVNDKMLDKLVSCDVSGVDLKTVEPRSFCEGCVQGKATKHKPKPLGEIRSTRRLEKVHSDVCGPMQTASNSGKKYMVAFVDDYSRTCAVYFMAHKSDTFAMFQEFHAKVAGESGERIGVLKTDGGGEYRSREFADYLRKHQIAHEVTVPDLPEMNGIAERMNRTILEKAKCMCVHADLPKSLWAEAASTACYVYNRLPNAPLKCKSPYEVWYSRKPDLSNLRVFGCVAYALVPAAKRKKFDNRTEKMRFLGYHKGHRGYKLMEKGSNRVFYRTDVTFDESNFKLTEEKPVTEGRRIDETTVEVDVGCSGSRAGLPVELPADVPAVEQEEDVSEQRENPKAVAVPREREEMPVAEHQRPTRNRKQVVRYGVEEQIHVAEEVIASALCAAEMEEPKTMSQAKKRPDAVKWMRAAKRKMYVHQMDVHTAFLNGKLEEDIYMCQPEGFEVKGKEDLVCHLHRSLYGLKQSPRCWNKELSCHLVKTGFQQSIADPCVFFQWKDGKLNVVSIYVDDLILVVDMLEDLQKTKEELSARFKMKDLGQVRYCLGIVCDVTDGKICVNQKPYIENLVRRFGLSDACGVSTPADACVKLVADDGVSRPADPKLYQ